MVKNAEQIIEFTTSSTSNNKYYYTKNADFSIYVTRNARKKNVNSTAMKALLKTTQKTEFAKLLSDIFPHNTANRNLLRKVNFHKINTYERHGQLDNA